MRFTYSRSGQTRPGRILQAVLFVTAMVCITLPNSNAQAATVVPSAFRIMGETGRIEDATLIAATFNVRPPRRFGIHRLEAALGGIATSDETRPFVSFGPVWRMPIDSEAFYIELGISPTLLGGSSINGSDLGGSFHFTSSAAIGTTFGATGALALALRIQHTSNGGLASDNPGMDMVGLNLSINFLDR